MITNIPSPEKYERAAKNVFFAGWNDLLHLITDFERFRSDESHIADDWAAERERYYQHCHVELEKICFWACQANELALKAMICEVSPFLLLLGTETRFKASKPEIDFSDLHTVDAVDLPNIVNAVSNRSLSAKYVERYGLLRRWRNKITHQGTADTAFTPADMVALMSEQYGELWPEKRFVADWMRYLSGTRLSYFHDGKWSTPSMELCEMLDTFFATLTSGQLKTLTGRAKGARRYVCHRCFWDGSLGRAYDLSEFRTAYVEKDSLYCLVCEETYPVRRADCGSGCQGNVISAAEEFDGLCHTCGEGGRPRIAVRPVGPASRAGDS
ncbi:hypothetical protein [Ensifer sp. Root127]|uniref:hypothetical protein n=1 Tax=Ensifer sp. Root127 TaxID=1736440 RepID=UPI00070EE6A9|nr:hypothetical protein [Ensifer sp. Root127]KQW77851.1 hypothetical protein ASD03_26805 [Ensifer sp. Root127]